MRVSISIQPAGGLPGATMGLMGVAGQDGLVRAESALPAGGVVTAMSCLACRRGLFFSMPAELAPSTQTLLPARAEAHSCPCGAELRRMVGCGETLECLLPHGNGGSARYMAYLNASQRLIACGPVDPDQAAGRPVRGAMPRQVTCASCHGQIAISYVYDDACTPELSAETLAELNNHQHRSRLRLVSTECHACGSELRRHVGGGTSMNLQTPTLRASAYGDGDGNAIVTGARDLLQYDAPNEIRLVCNNCQASPAYTIEPPLSESVVVTTEPIWSGTDFWQPGRPPTPVQYPPDHQYATGHTAPRYCPHCQTDLTARPAAPAHARATVVGTWQAITGPAIEERYLIVGEMTARLLSRIPAPRDMVLAGVVCRECHGSLATSINTDATFANPVLAPQRHRNVPARPAAVLDNSPLECPGCGLSNRVEPAPAPRRPLPLVVWTEQTDPSVGPQPGFVSRSGRLSVEATNTPAETTQAPIRSVTCAACGADRNSPAAPVPDPGPPVAAGDPELRATNYYAISQTCSNPACGVPLQAVPGVYPLWATINRGEDETTCRRIARIDASGLISVVHDFLPTHELAGVRCVACQSIQAMRRLTGTEAGVDHPAQSPSFPAVTAPGAVPPGYALLPIRVVPYRCVCGVRFGAAPSESENLRVLYQGQMQTTVRAIRLPNQQLAVREDPAALGPEHIFRIECPGCRSDVEFHRLEGERAAGSLVPPAEFPAASQPAAAPQRRLRMRPPRPGPPAAMSDRTQQVLSSPAPVLSSPVPALPGQRMTLQQMLDSPASTTCLQLLCDAVRCELMREMVVPPLIPVGLEMRSRPAGETRMFVRFEALRGYDAQGLPIQLEPPLYLDLDSEILGNARRQDPNTYHHIIHRLAETLRNALFRRSGIRLPPRRSR